MDTTFDGSDCLTTSCCPATSSKVVCHCLQVTEDALLQALQTLELRSLKDIRQHTGAGEGCTACHRRLRRYLEKPREPAAAVAAELAQASSSDSPI